MKCYKLKGDINDMVRTFMAYKLCNTFRFEANNSVLFYVPALTCIGFLEVHT